MIRNKWVFLSCLLIFGLFIGCGHNHDHTEHEEGEHATHKAESQHAEDKHHAHHAHHAPHGGTLVVFGEEFAHLEMVLDEKKGELIGYVLDGEAEKSIRIQQKEIKMNIELNKGDKFELPLKSSSNELTGETAGDTSEFRGQSDKLKGVHQFKAVINTISIRGKTFGKTKFQFPEGNETNSGHAH